MEIKEFNEKLREFGELVRIEEKKISESKNNIYKLNSERDRFIQSCNHKFDDGKSAWKDTGYWVCDTYTYIDDWTGEECIGDRGYSKSQRTCQICGHDEEW